MPLFRAGETLIGVANLSSKILLDVTNAWDDKQELSHDSIANLYLAMSVNM